MVLFGFLRRAEHENGRRNTRPLHGTDTQNKLITWTNERLGKIA